MLTETVPHFSNPENARQARAKQTQQAQQTKAELENLRLLLAKPIELAQQPSQQTVGPTISIACTREQIEAIDTQLSDCTDPKAWDALTRAKERLFRIWAHLAQIPGPGNLKPTQRQTQRRAIEPVVPVEPAPVLYGKPGEPEPNG